MAKAIDADDILADLMVDDKIDIGESVDKHHLGQAARAFADAVDKKNFRAQSAHDGSRLT
eukprot:scaffold1805_cov51-Skeletonema_menzelii.AAC.1